MKTNIFKYIFFIVVIILIILSVYYIRKDEKNKNGEQPKEIEQVEKIKLTDLRIGVAQFDTINPILSNNKSVQEISRLIFDSLLILDKEYKLQPGIAKEYSKIDEYNYIIKLNENIKWHNGTELTSRDVKFTIDRIKDSNSIYSYNLEHVIALEIIDNYTIRIKLDQEVPFFEYNLTFPILSNDYYYEQDFITTQKNNNPVGTGLYKISEVNDDVIILKRNQDYWKTNEDFVLDTININIYSSIGELYNAFKIDNIDLISTSILNIEEYIGTIGFNKKEYKGREYDFLAMNCENIALNNLEVRQVISCSIDKANLISRVYNNQYYVANFPLDYESWLNNIEYKVATYDSNKAKEILSKNGWNNSNNVWQKRINNRNVKLEFDLVVLDKEKRVQVADIIKEQLENVGIKINVKKVNQRSYDNYLENKNYDIILAGTYFSFSPDLILYFGEGNLSNFKDEESLGIINDMKNITDDSLVKEKFSRLVEIYNAQIPYVSLTFSKNTVIYSNNLMGDISPNNYNIFYNVQNWYREY